MRKTATHEIEGHSPLVVTPREACRLLAIGNTKLYAELSAGELQSYLDGRSRRITMESIRRYIEKRLATSGRAVAPMPPKRKKLLAPLKLRPRTCSTVRRRHPRWRRPARTLANYRHHVSSENGEARDER